MSVFSPGLVVVSTLLVSCSDVKIRQICLFVVCLNPAVALSVAWRQCRPAINAKGSIHILLKG